MGGPFVLAIDQGTSASTALVLDHSDSAKNIVLASASSEFKQYYPQSGWVEHELEDIWTSVRQAVLAAIEKAELANKDFSAKKIAAIGITNQRETICFIDRKSGQSLRRAIVWQCRRSQDLCKDLREKDLDKEIREKTGLLIDPYFSGTKIMWALQNDRELSRSFENKQVLCGTIDTFLIHRLSSGQKFVTEPSNASRTLLFNIHSGEWDARLCELMGLKDQDCLASVQDSAGLFAKTKGLDFLPDGIPISGVLGDQQAALAGQGCFDPGEAKCTYGTGAFLLMQLGKEACISKNRLLTTVAWSLAGQYSYAFEGSAFIAGAAIQFMRDQLKALTFAEESASLAKQVVAAPDIYFVPALCGLGAPWWHANARGAFLGLTRGTDRRHLVRAALEGINFQVCDLLAAMNQDSGQAINVLKVDGGASSNELLMQMQADLANLTVERPACLESTALGAGFFASLGLGIYSSLDDIKSQRTQIKTFYPHEGGDQKSARIRKKDGWARAVRAAQVFAGDQEGT